MPGTFSLATGAGSRQSEPIHVCLPSSLQGEIRVRAGGKMNWRTQQDCADTGVTTPRHGATTGRHQVATRGIPSVRAGPTQSRTRSGRFYRRLIHQHNGDIVAYGVDPVTLDALQALWVRPMLQFLFARGANQNFQQIFGNHDSSIVRHNRSRGLPQGNVIFCHRACRHLIPRSLRARPLYLNLIVFGSAL